MSIESPWRQAFPALARFEQEGIRYLDSAATTQKPQALLDALLHHYQAGCANVHRAQHLPGERSTRAFEDSRQRIAAWLNAGDNDALVFTRGATESLNLLAYGLEDGLQAGDEIVISALEHHANLLPWQQLAQRRNLRLVVLPLAPTGHVDLDQARSLIGPRCRILAISQLSNVLGTWQPLPALLAMARAQGATCIVDGAQGIVHGRTDLQQLDCDFYVFSGHKLYGPDGIGVLHGRRPAFTRLRHWQFGGEMLEDADYHQARFRPAPLGFEAGTPAIAAAIGLAASLAWLDSLPQHALQRHEAELHAYLLDGLRQRPGVQILGQPDTALVSFTVDQVQAADLSHLLGEQGIAVRGGQHCAMPLFKRLGLPGAIRVSLGLYNDQHDLDALFLALDNALELLR